MGRAEDYECRYGEGAEVMKRTPDSGSLLARLIALVRADHPELTREESLRFVVEAIADLLGVSEKGVSDD